MKQAGVPYRFLGGGSNVLLPDGELPWVILQLARRNPEVRIEGTTVVGGLRRRPRPHGDDVRQDDLGGMEGLIGVPGTIGGALRMNAGAYGTQIGTYVREVQVYRGANT